MKIEDILARRTDLSTFLVHLCRSDDDESAKQRLVSILRSAKIKARTPFGQAVKRIERRENGLTRRQRNAALASQRCVCFTETPLEHVSLLMGDIEGRTCKFEPYGIAITKRQGRRSGVNPVWYVDITPGHPWLTEPLNEIVDAAIAARNFEGSEIAQLTPFIEQMGSGGGVSGPRCRRPDRSDAN